MESKSQMVLEQQTEISLLFSFFNHSCKGLLKHTEIHLWVEKTLRESCGCTAIQMCGQRTHIMIHYNYSTDLMSRLTLMNVLFNLDGWLNSPRLQMNLSPQTQLMEVKIHTTQKPGQYRVSISDYVMCFTKATPGNLIAALFWYWDLWLCEYRVLQWGEWRWGWSRHSWDVCREHGSADSRLSACE